MDWLSAVEQLRRDGLPGVLVTVIKVRGHAPRDAGAKMVVGADHTWGSVGGGNLEEAAVRRARELIASGTPTPETQEARLNEHARNQHGRQCCGGEVTLLLEPLPARPVIAVFGVGHVGYELARILSRLDVQLHLVDSREEELDQLRLADVTDGSADVAVHHALLGEQVLEMLPRGAHVLIMTHDHAEDFALCDAALRLPDVGQHRADRVQRQVDRVPAPAGRAGPRAGGDRPHHQPDRPAGDHRQGARGHRGQRRRRRCCWPCSGRPTPAIPNTGKLLPTQPDRQPDAPRSDERTALR